MSSHEIKIILLQRKTSQRQMAEELDLSPTAICRILSGDLVVDARLNEIAAYLGISRPTLNRMIGNPQSPIRHSHLSTLHSQLPKEAPNDRTTPKSPRPAPAQSGHGRSPLPAPAALAQDTQPLH